MTPATLTELRRPEAAALAATKGKPVDGPITMDAKLLSRAEFKALTDFIERLAAYGDELGCWPMTPDEQAYFIRWTISDARKLRKLWRRE